MQFDWSVFQGFESNKEPKKSGFVRIFQFSETLDMVVLQHPPYFLTTGFFTLTLKISGIIINFSFASVGNVL